MKRTLFYGGASAVLGACIGAVYTLDSPWLIGFVALFAAGMVSMVKGDEDA